MGQLYVAAMDRVYLLCVGICVLAVVVMTGLIFTGVVMRYIFLMGAQFAEPLSIFFAVQLTMYGAAACYRAGSHLALELFVQRMPEALGRACRTLVLLLIAGTALFMVVYGISLTQTTWFQAYPEFPYVRVGFVYSAIPGSGIATLLFVIEAAFFAKPDGGDGEEALRRALEHGEEEARRLQV